MENNLKRDWPDYVFLAFIVSLLVLTFVVGVIKPLEEEEKVEWCEVGTVEDDGTVHYSSDLNQEELIIMATTDGPKVMSQNCN